VVSHRTPLRSLYLSPDRLAAWFEGGPTSKGRGDKGREGKVRRWEREGDKRGWKIEGEGTPL